LEAQLDDTHPLRPSSVPKHLSEVSFSLPHPVPSAHLFHTNFVGTRATIMRRGSLALLGCRVARFVLQPACPEGAEGGDDAEGKV
jgi:hypothetical protein